MQQQNYLYSKNANLKLWNINMSCQWKIYAHNYDTYTHLCLLKKTHNYVPFVWMAYFYFIKYLSIVDIRNWIPSYIETMEFPFNSEWFLRDCLWNYIYCIQFNVTWKNWLIMFIFSSYIILYFACGSNGIIYIMCIEQKSVLLDTNNSEGSVCSVHCHSPLAPQHSFSHVF